VEQKNFLNGAIAIETLYTPEELLESLHEIEKAGGRERNVHWGPRTIDLDILLYEDIVMSTDTLTIPHGDMQNRDFVLAPLAQIAPYAMHPILHQSVKQMYREVKKHGEKHYWLAEEFDAGLGI
jgi:dihydroneopterin aldolase/2-amino-4-hydroxy-6-hydroxymethyldihydropteridine diphosphokinase